MIGSGTGTGLGAGPSWKGRAKIAAAIVAVSAMAALVWGACKWQRRSSLWEAAQQAARLGDWDRTQTLLTQRAWWAGEDEASARLHSFAALKRDDDEAAARVLAKVQDRWPAAPDLWAELGKIRLRQFRLADAETAFRRCLNRVSGHEAALLGTSAILAMQQRPREYDACLFTLLESPDLGLRLQALRLLTDGVPVIPLGADGRPVDELQALKAAFASNPDSPLIRRSYARQLHLQGDDDAARSLLQPLGDQAALTQARIALDEGDADHARVWLDAVGSSRDGESEVWALRGELLLRSAPPREAIAAFERARALGSRSPELLHRLAAAHRLARDAEQSRTYQQLYEQALDLIAIAGIQIKAEIDASKVQEAERICRALGRDREADGWASLLRDGARS